MAMKKMSNYIFSFLLLFMAVHTKAQEDDWMGISIGADLSRIAVPIIDSTRYGWEFSADYEIIEDLFGCIEIGSQTTEFDSDYHYHSFGGYTRIGVDYNFIEFIDKQSTDNVFIGIRYAHSNFYHEADNIIIQDDIWGDYEDGEIKRKWLNANWMEITPGMRARIFNNFYLGWSVRFRIMLWQKDDPDMQPYFIPGYGRAWSNNRIGFNYSIYYKIPLLKKRSAREEKEITKKSP